MKKTALAKVMVCAGLVAGLTVAASADQQQVPVKTEQQKAAVKAAAPEEILVTLKAPLFAPEFAAFPAVKVNDDIITLADLNESLSMVHEGMAEGQMGKKTNISEVLDRLINSKLIIQEAENMGLDQLPEVKDLLDANTRKTLREALMTRHIKDLKPNEAEIEKAYKEKIVEWKLTSLVFKDEAQAKKAEKELKAGKPFAAIFEKATKEKLAEGKQDESYLNSSNLSPGIVKILGGLKAGATTPALALEKGFLIFKIVDVKYNEDPRLKETVAQEVLTATRLKALKAYRDELIRKHLKENKKLVAALDFEAEKPGFEKLMKDTRVLAEVKGLKPVTIADLAEKIREKFFHGVEAAIKEKKVNKAKTELLLNLYSDRVLEKEAHEQGLDKEEAIEKKIDDYRTSVLFGTFVEKVVQPEVKLSLSELETYYKEHIGEFTYPEMFRIEAIAFASSKDAEAAIDKLRKGMDYKWFKTNAEGMLQGAPKLNFDGNIIVRSQLPEGVQKALTGVKSGEYRQYEQDGEHYVLNVLEQIPPREQPMKEVEETIRKAVFFDKLNKSIEAWASKLREATDIKMYVDFRK